MIKLRLNKKIDDKVLVSYKEKVARINKMIDEKTGAGADAPLVARIDFP